MSWGLDNKFTYQDAKALGMDGTSTLDEFTGNLSDWWNNSGGTLGDVASSGLTLLGDGLNKLTTPIGTGANAQSWLGYGLQAYNILKNDKRQRQQLALAKQNLALQKAALQGNFTQNATNWMNQNLWQTQAMYNFDPEQGAKRAGDVLAGLNQLNSAASSLGMGSNAFGQQKDALTKYTQLKPNVNSQGGV